MPLTFSLMRAANWPERGIVEKADAQPHQMIEYAFLVARDEVVADPGKRDNLAVGGETADNEGQDDRAADERHALILLSVKQVVDNRSYDPCNKPGRRRDRDQTSSRQHIVPEILTAILRENAADDGGDFAGIRPISGLSPGMSTLGSFHVLLNRIDRRSRGIRDAAPVLSR